MKSPPHMSGEGTALAFDMSAMTLKLPAGHAVTMRDHHCGGFKDDFDWSSLPLPYQKAIGAPLTHPRTHRQRAPHAAARADQDAGAQADEPERERR